MCIIFCPNQYIVCYIINIILRVEEVSSVCLLSFCLSDVPVSFIFANLTKMFGNQADLEGDYHLT